MTWQQAREEGSQDFKPRLSTRRDKRLEYITEGEANFASGTIIKLDYDDNSGAPSFRSIALGQTSYVNWHRVRPHNFTYIED